VAAGTLLAALLLWLFGKVVKVLIWILIAVVLVGVSTPSRACSSNDAGGGFSAVRELFLARSNHGASRSYPVKYIFVTGGVVSSLGKGLTAAALGALLELRGLVVRIQKFDPYLNVDPGTMSPFQHGEVYVLEDGAETDLDLGHYEALHQRQSYRGSTAFRRARFTRASSRRSGAVTISARPCR
jgi:hypothetical protein